MRILVLSHNTPFPPNKGDKIRAYHMIRGLAQHHEVHLLSLSKDPADVRYLSDLRSVVKTAEIFPLKGLYSKIFALLCVLSPFPLTFGFFFSRGLRSAIAQKLRSEKFDLVFCFCSSTAQYVQKLASPPVIVDFVDIDSAKWAEYAEIKSFPKSLIFALECKRLRAWEAAIHRHSLATLLTTNRERKRLLELAPEKPETINVVPNGIDVSQYAGESPVSASPIVVFTGQMDYLPNIDAVVYFYHNVWPLIKKEIPFAEFQIIGRNPPPELRETCPTAFISGEVDDVRPFLRRARVFVAPLRLSFGSQLKVLEAMASDVPVVATSNVVEGLLAVPDRDLLVADEPVQFAEKVLTLLRDEMLSKRIAGNAKAYVRENHDWSKISETLEGLLSKALSDETAQPARDKNFA